MSAYLEITGHYLADWTLKSVMMACTRMKGRHTSENIRHYYEETLVCYGIFDKKGCVVTDNASNMKKTFASLPGYDKEMDDYGRYEICYEDEHCSDGDGEGDTCPDKYNCIPLHLPCYAHTLQLVIKDEMKECI